MVVGERNGCLGGERGVWEEKQGFGRRKGGLGGARLRCR